MTSLPKSTSTSTSPFFDDSTFPAPTARRNQTRTTTMTMTKNNNQNEYENPWESAANDQSWDAATTTSDDDRDHRDGEWNTIGGGGGGSMNSPSLTAMETSTTAYLNGDTNDRRAAAEASSSSSSSCAYQCFQACHVLDIIGGIALLIYDWLVISKRHHPIESKDDDNVATIFLTLLSSLWIVRGLLAKTTRCGVKVSATCSLCLAWMYALFAILLWILMRWFGVDDDPPGTTTGTNDARDHYPCLVFPTEWCPKDTNSYLPPGMLIVILFLLAVYEAIRHVWIKQWMWQESTQIRDDLNASDMIMDGFRRTGGRRPYSPDHGGRRSPPPPRRRSRPWWWNMYSHSSASTSSSFHVEPLLSNGQPRWTTSNSGAYHMESGVDGGNGGTTVAREGRYDEERNNHIPRSSSWWPFGRRRSRHDRQGEDVRDDASVEYASLNEDWASRSEEDPFWWTREGEGG